MAKICKNCAYKEKNHHKENKCPPYDDKKFEAEEKTYNESAHDVLEGELNKKFKAEDVLSNQYINKPIQKGCGKRFLIENTGDYICGGKAFNKLCPKCEPQKYKSFHCSECLGFFEEPHDHNPSLNAKDTPEEPLRSNKSSGTFNLK